MLLNFNPKKPSKMAPKKRIRTTESFADPDSPTGFAAAKLAQNDDALTKILVRLPIKSLQRFKSVSKHWLSLISDPAFSRLRTPHPSSVSGLVLRLSEFQTGYGHEYDFVDLNRIPDDGNVPDPPPFRALTFVEEYRSGIEILQSCNGLLLCRTARVHELRRSYYVYNPVTRKYLTVIPRPKICRRKIAAGQITNICRIGLAFDPSESAHYKVVCLYRCEDSQELFRIQIYSSETRSWQPSSAGTFPARISFALTAAVYWNGSVHWIDDMWTPSLQFNINEDRLYDMETPDPRDDNPWSSSCRIRELAYFGESRGHLHLIYQKFEPRTTCINVFEMEKDRSGWLVKYKVDLAEVSAAFPEMIPLNYSSFRRPMLDDYRMCVLGVVRGEREEDSYLAMYIPGNVVRYNLKSETFFKLCDLEPQRAQSSLFPRWVEVHQYIESLTASV